MRAYAVIESTPGYMPEVLDPPVFPTKREAVGYARALVQELREEGYHRIRSYGSRKWVCERDRHDLGRVIEVESIEDDPGAFDIGTCQSCGAYWNPSQTPICPCGGEVL